MGIQAVRELLAQLAPGELSGQVIFVPVVNAGGFFAGTYRVPEDGENLNRCFPGVKGCLLYTSRRSVHHRHH